MSWRFRKTIKLTPFFRINVSKTGLSLTVGRSGGSVTVSEKDVTAGVGLPGTGLSYRAKLFRWLRRGES